MSPLVPEPAPNGGALASPACRTPINTHRQLIDLLQQVRVDQLPTISRSQDDLFFVAPGFATVLADALWPALLETVKRARIEELEPAQVRLMESAIAQREWTEDAEQRKAACEAVLKSFTYHAPKDDQPGRYEWLRREAKDVALLIMDFCPASRERSLAITKLEEAVMWANKAIAVNE